MLNSYPHIQSLIAEDAFAHMKDTKRTHFQKVQSDVIILHVRGAAVKHEIARLKFDVSDTFVGFHVFHTCHNSVESLMYSYNLGSPCEIRAMVKFARQCGSNSPADVDEWVVKNVVSRAAKFKKIANLLCDLHLTKTNNAPDIISSIESLIGMSLNAHIETYYNAMLGNDFSLFEDAMQDLSEDFFSDLQKTKKIKASVVSADDDDSDDSDPDEINEGELLTEEARDDRVDLLNKLSTRGVVQVFNAVIREGSYTFTGGKIYETSCIERRNHIIDELANLFNIQEIHRYAKMAGLSKADKAFF